METILAKFSLLFYQKDDPVDEEATGKVTSGIHAIVNSCIARERTSSERMKNMQETQLCTWWELELNPKEEPGRQYPRGQHPNVAVMYSRASQGNTRTCLCH
jgi:hypothetical protein